MPHSRDYGLGVYMDSRRYSTRASQSLHTVSDVCWSGKAHCLGNKGDQVYLRYSMHQNSIVVCQSSVSCPDLPRPDLPHPNILCPDLPHPNILCPNLLYHPNILCPNLLYYPNILCPDIHNLHPFCLNLICPDLHCPDTRGVLMKGCGIVIPPSLRRSALI